jgi:hypothetical protein
MREGYIGFDGSLNLMQRKGEFAPFTALGDLNVKKEMPRGRTISRCRGTVPAKTEMLPRKKFAYLKCARRRRNPNS